MIHVDVMDGHFVPNLTIGPPVIKALRKHCSIKFDVHLMISPVHKYIEAYADAGADIITIHPEATENLEESILKIKSLNKKVGVSLNPGSKLDLITNYLEKIDLVLIMSVNPGLVVKNLCQKYWIKLNNLKKLNLKGI
jgi:ribulose-phosphate 3-epimerase